MTKDKYACGTVIGIPFAMLTGLDNFPALNALANPFGDSYLYRHNPIYTRIRHAAFSFGYRFSAEDTPLWRDYQSLSLLSLHQILSAKIIPYFDTATSFRRLAVSYPFGTASAGFYSQEHEAELRVS